ncbi:hypothetical protein [Streptomyces sp. NPDC002133]|uniref:hypothetical protein n=1 Tax=Streptomyces sp. NPDC002133 TaxID=3154409 RepID=UPI00331BDE88
MPVGLTAPRAGENSQLDLHSNKLAIAGSEGLILVVLHAEPGCRSAELLRLLRSLVASGDGTPRESDRSEVIEEQWAEDLPRRGAGQQAARRLFRTPPRSAARTWR